MTQTNPHVVIHPARTARLFGLIAVGLTLLSFAVQFVIYDTPYGDLPGLAKLDAGWEESVPTYYSSVLLLAAAFLLGLIARARRMAGEPFARHWLALAVIFVALSTDEVVCFHEGLTVPVRNALHTGGALYYAWVVPAMGMLAALALVYSRFLLHLPRPVRRQFVLAAVIYVGGAVGLELAGGVLAAYSGEHTLAYGLLATAEEAFEMIGVVLFIRALLRYAGRDLSALRIQVAGV